MPVWLQILNGGAGVALLSGVFSVILARGSRKAAGKAGLAVAEEERHTELLQAIKTLESLIKKLQDASIATQYDRITYLAGIYLARGSVTVSEHQSLMSIYNSYKDIGGNGSIESLMDMFQKLQIK